MQLRSPSAGHHTHIQTRARKKKKKKEAGKEAHTRYQAADRGHDIEGATKKG